jgi:hypothetical protein
MRPAPGAHGRLRGGPRHPLAAHRRHIALAAPYQQQYAADDTARRKICDFRTFPAHGKTRISQIGRPESAG